MKEMYEVSTIINPRSKERIKIQEGKSDFPVNKASFLHDKHIVTSLEEKS